MKNLSKSYVLLMALCLAASCSELKDDDHYGKSDSQISNNELKIVDVSSKDYIKGRSDLSSMNDLFVKQPVLSQQPSKLSIPF